MENRGDHQGDGQAIGQGDRYEVFTPCRDHGAPGDEHEHEHPDELCQEASGEVHASEDGLVLILHED